MNHVTGKWLTLLLTLLLLTGVAYARAITPDPTVDYRLVGSGNLTWLGIKVYRAELYTPKGDFRDSEPHALKIIYNFSFGREQLVQSSMDQIERLYGPVFDEQYLRAQLESILTGVESGDFILAHHIPGERLQLFGSEGYLGSLDDPDLAISFMGIWLNPETQEPDLRARLIGERR